MSSCLGQTSIGSLTRRKKSPRPLYSSPPRKSQVPHEVAGASPLRRPPGVLAHAQNRRNLLVLRSKVSALADSTLEKESSGNGTFWRFRPSIRHRLVPLFEGDPHRCFRRGSAIAPADDEYTRGTLLVQASLPPASWFQPGGIGKARFRQASAHARFRSCVGSPPGRWFLRVLGLGSDGFAWRISPVLRQHASCGGTAQPACGGLAVFHSTRLRSAAPKLAPTSVMSLPSARCLSQYSLSRI